MAETVNLNELLQKMKVKDSSLHMSSQKVSPPNRKTQVEQLLRPLRFICSDIIRAMEDQNGEAREKKLQGLKQELLMSKQSKIPPRFSLPPSAPEDLKRLLETQTDRVRLTDEMNQTYLMALSDMIESIKGIQSTAKKMYQKKAKKINQMESNWNKRADNISRNHHGIVTKNQRIIEKDWVRLVKQNHALETLAGGGSATHRLELAQELGSQPTDTCIGRAKVYDKSKAVHETVHWRLRDTVDSVTSAYLKRLKDEHQKTVRQHTSNATCRGRDHIATATSDYNVADTPLKYEVQLLQNALENNHISSHAVTQYTLTRLEHQDKKYRLKIAALL